MSSTPGCQRRTRRAHRTALQGASIAWVLACFAVPPRGLAQEDEPALEEDPIQSGFRIDDVDPERSVPTQDQALKQPLQMGYFIMELTERGEAAIKRGDPMAAAGYFRALAKAVPDRSASFTKLCHAYDAAGDLTRARESCKEALGKGGVTLDDHAYYVQLVLRKEGALESSEIDDLDAIIGHIDSQLREQPETNRRLVVNHLKCQLGMRLADVPRLQACTRELETLAPQDHRTLTYRWTLAFKQQDFDRAEQLLDSAKQAGIPQATLERMQEATRVERDRLHPWRKRLRESWLAAVLGIALGAAVLTSFAWRRVRHRTSLAR